MKRRKKQQVFHLCTTSGCVWYSSTILQRYLGYTQCFSRHARLGNIFNYDVTPHYSALSNHRFWKSVTKNAIVSSRWFN